MNKHENKTDLTFMTTSLKAGLYVLATCLPLAASDHRTLVTLKGATVADVLCSEYNSHTGFNMPLAPVYTQRKSMLHRAFSSAPEELHTYAAFYKTQSGTLTTTAMLRFIKESHTLFPDTKRQALYKKAVKQCINAHKQWYSEQTPATLRILRASEDAVFEHLTTLNLTDERTRSALEKVLSTRPKSNLTKIANKIARWLGLPLYVLKESGSGEPVIQHTHKIPALQALKITSPIILGLLYAEWNFRDLSSRALVQIMTGFLAYSLAVLTAVYTSDSRYEANEPGEGIKVVIKLSHQ